MRHSTNRVFHRSESACTNLHEVWFPTGLVTAELVVRSGPAPWCHRNPILVGFPIGASPVALWPRSTWNRRSRENRSPWRGCATSAATGGTTDEPAYRTAARVHERTVAPTDTTFDLSVHIDLIGQNEALSGERFSPQRRSHPVPQHCPTCRSTAHLHLEHSIAAVVVVVAWSCHGCGAEWSLRDRRTGETDTRPAPSTDRRDISP